MYIFHCFSQMSSTQLDYRFTYTPGKHSQPSGQSTVPIYITKHTLKSYKQNDL